ncbi:MAG TPA: hypothetical protein VLF40_02615 [Candidatus Saccharimonadales bacterium]|nr:hypothetical protein [Candidatus Saccharimonadales bacterium]
MSQAMNVITQEDLPPTEYESARDEALALTEKLVGARAFPALVASFGTELPPNYDSFDLSYKLSLLRAFTVTHLDVRKGKERWQVGDVAYTAEQEAAIADVVAELHMQGETYAQLDSYDAAQVLGGRAVGTDGAAASGTCALRIDKLAREIERGVRVPYVFLLGSARPLDDVEQAAYPGARTEFDALTMAFERRFGIERGVTAEVEDFQDVQHRPGERDAWRIRHYALADGTHAFAVSAPAREGRERASTPDTYRFIQALISHDMLPRGSLLSITTDLYVPFQCADALRQLGLPMDIKVETIGCDGADRPTSSYAAEINSAVKQTDRLYDALLAQADVRDFAGAYDPAENPILDALVTKLAA